MPFHGYKSALQVTKVPHRLRKCPFMVTKVPENVIEVPFPLALSLSLSLPPPPLSLSLPPPSLSLSLSVSLSLCEHSECRFGKMDFFAVDFYGFPYYPGVEKGQIAMSCFLAVAVAAKNANEVFKRGIALLVIVRGFYAMHDYLVTRIHGE